MKSEEKFYEFEDLNSSTNTQFNNVTGDKIDTYVQTLIGLMLENGVVGETCCYMSRELHIST